MPSFRVQQQCQQQQLRTQAPIKDAHSTLTHGLSLSVLKRTICASLPANTIFCVLLRAVAGTWGRRTLNGGLKAAAVRANFTREYRVLLHDLTAQCLNTQRPNVTYGTPYVPGPEPLTWVFASYVTPSGVTTVDTTGLRGGWRASSKPHPALQKQQSHQKAMRLRRPIV